MVDPLELQDLLKTVCFEFLDPGEEIFLEQTFFDQIAWHCLLLRIDLLLDSACHASQLLFHIGFKECDLVWNGQVHIKVLCKFFCDNIYGTLSFIDVVGLDARARL